MNEKCLSCEAVIYRLLAHLEQHPDRPLDPAIEAHLRACRDCYGRAEFEQRLRSGARDRLTCEEVLKVLFDYLDRELDEVMTASIDRHLELCRDCFSRAEFERRLRAKVGEMGTAKAPARLQQRVKGLIGRF